MRQKLTCRGAATFPFARGVPLAAQFLGFGGEFGVISGGKLGLGFSDFEGHTYDFSFSRRVRVMVPALTALSTYLWTEPIDAPCLAAIWGRVRPAR